MYSDAATYAVHDDVIKRKLFLRYWPFERGIHLSPVNSPHKGQWCGPLMFSLIWAWINGWVNNGEAGDLRRHRAHYDVTVMIKIIQGWLLITYDNTLMVNFRTYITRPYLVNTLRSRQNGNRFTDNIFKCIFFNENVGIRLKFHWRLFLKAHSILFQRWFR